MDIVTYALLKGDISKFESKVDNLPPAFDYKGAVATVSDLPDNASVGDSYSVGSVVYFWDGTEWNVTGSQPITNTQIDAIFAVN